MSRQQGVFDLEALRGTVAVVTGAGNNGIGWGICKHAAGRLGMHVVAADLHDNLVNEAAARLRAEFPDVRSIGVRCDVTKPESLQDCLQTVQRELPGLRIGAVFANAGVIFNHTILRSTAAEWMTTLNVNVIGVVIGIVRERYENLLQLQLDNSDAWTEGPWGPPSSILKGPMFQELKRRAAAGDG